MPLRRNPLTDVSLAPYIDPQAVTAMPAPTFSQFTLQPPPEDDNGASQFGASAVGLGHTLLDRDAARNRALKLMKQMNSGPISTSTDVPITSL